MFSKEPDPEPMGVPLGELQSIIDVVICYVRKYKILRLPCLKLPPINDLHN